MKLWLLYPKDEDSENKNQPWWDIYDMAYGFVIRAETELDARQIAAVNCGDEGGRAWIMSHYSICEELLPDGESGVILRDYHAG